MTPPHPLDHLVYATPNLANTVAALHAQLGVAPSAGGQHPTLGTRNALLALGPRVYLEIVGPDPDQPTPATPRWFGIDSLSAPRLVAWCAAAPDVARLHARAGAAGVPLGEVRQGGRVRPDGVALNWHVTTPPDTIERGVVPFFIDWLDSPHPADTAAAGATLVDFHAEHVNPDLLRSHYTALSVDVPVHSALGVALVAVIDGPYGRVTLR